MAGAAGLLAAILAPAKAGANTLNIHVRPHLQVNTTLHVDVKPRLYRDVAFTESCVNYPKRNDHSATVRKRCRLDD
ncbi:hypothetical protein [Bradyrhizobium sp. SYSU BS000235]|uniref:hypothetical protein n=1 Tax=Bradyrhizobium sp. SYSU BS000235 TaxID=3411332 RepID=UPI003C74B9D2